MSGSERVNNISGLAGLMSQDDNIGDRMSPLLGLNPWSNALLARPFVSFVGFCLKLFLELPTDSPLTFVFFELFVVEESKRRKRRQDFACFLRLVQASSWEAIFRFLRI
jgi:hypothetical protein